MAAFLLLLFAIDLEALRRSALAGDKDAQYEASRLARLGVLKGISPKQAAQWRKSALERAHPPACLEEAENLLADTKDAEAFLLCAAQGQQLEAQYLLGRYLLEKTAAEDEPRRFTGLSWLALAARSGHPGALRKWELIAAELVAEELELVEQKVKALARFAIQPSITTVH